MRVGRREGCATLLVMCMAAFGAFVACFIAAVGFTAAAEGLPWHVLTLWGAGATTGAPSLICGMGLASKYLRPIQIKSNWRCQYWTRQQQIMVTLWFDDRLNSTEYKAECTVHINEACFPLTPYKLVESTSARAGS